MGDSEYTVVPFSKAKAPIWKHFGVRKRKNDGSLVENIAVCLTCNSDVKTAGGTSNMSTHIKRHHPQLLTAQYSNPSASQSEHTEQTPKTAKKQLFQQSLTGAFQAQAKKKKYPTNSPRAKAITNQIALFLVKDLRPYKLVESTHFRSLIETLDDRFQVPSRKHFSGQAVPEMYERMKVKVSHQLQKAEQVSYCIIYIYVCVHFTYFQLAFKGRVC